MQYATKEEIPGYREEFAEAFRRQQTARDLSFLDYPRTILGETVRLPNLRDIAALSFAGNPFVAGGERNLLDALLVMWLLSPLHMQESGSRLRKWLVRRRRKRLFRRVIKKHTPEAVVDAVEKFMADCFVDCPQGSPEGQKPPLPRSSYPAEYVAFFMESVNASEEWVLSCPLPRLFQYLHAVCRIRDPKYTHDQPTDMVRRKYLAIFNAQPKDDQ